MPHITFIKPDGSRVEVDAEAGQTLMHAATLNDVEGIAAECGGSAMCATCHVYVESHGEALAAMQDDEDALLNGTAAERRPNSRLSCQIELTPALDGLLVRVPVLEE